jgi:hypothetical protein
MAYKIIYRLYTENKNKRDILRLVAKRFESFTVQPTLGYYRGKPERSIVIEIVGAAERDIKAVARMIGAMNGQKSVLVLKVRGQAKTSRT